MRIKKWRKQVDHRTTTLKISLTKMVTGIVLMPSKDTNKINLAITASTTMPQNSTTKKVATNALHSNMVTTNSKTVQTLKIQKTVAK